MLCLARPLFWSLYDPSQNTSHAFIGIYIFCFGILFVSCFLFPAVTHCSTGAFKQGRPQPTTVFRLDANFFSCCQNTSHQVKFMLSGQQRLSRRPHGGTGLSPILPTSLPLGVTRIWIGHRWKGLGTCQITSSGTVAGEKKNTEAQQPKNISLRLCRDAEERLAHSSHQPPPYQFKEAFNIHARALASLSLAENGLSWISRHEATGAGASANGETPTEGPSWCWQRTHLLTFIYTHRCSELCGLFNTARKMYNTDTLIFDTQGHIELFCIFSTVLELYLPWFSLDEFSSSLFQRRNYVDHYRNQSGHHQGAQNESQVWSSQVRKCKRLDSQTPAHSFFCFFIDKTRKAVTRLGKWGRVRPI